MAYTSAIKIAVQHYSQQNHCPCHTIVLHAVTKFPAVTKITQPLTPLSRLVLRLVLRMVTHLVLASTLLIDSHLNACTCRY